MRILYAVCVVIAAVLLFLTIFLGMVFSMYAAAAPSPKGFAGIALFILTAIALRAALKWLLERYSASPSVDLQ